MMSDTGSIVYVCTTPMIESLSAQTRNKDRSSLVRSLIHSIGLESYCCTVFPRKASRSEAALAHSKNYLTLLNKLSREAERKAGWAKADSSDDEDDDSDSCYYADGLLQQLEEAGFVDDCPIFPGVWDLAMLIVGGAIVAAERLILGGASVACWFEGGRHHAAADSANGFCYRKWRLHLMQVSSRSTSRFK